MNQTKFFPSKSETAKNRDIYVLLFSLESKLQILANLANFAYGPINYEYLRILNVIELFIGKKGSSI